MKLKWIGLIVCLFLAAFVVQNQDEVAPNQEISMRLKTSVSQTEVTLNDLKTQLEALGVAHLEVLKDDKGQFKISYFSELDANFIQNVLASNNSDFDVYNLDTKKEIPSGVNGKVVSERKTEANRFVSSNVNAAIKTATIQSSVVTVLKKDFISIHTKKYVSNTLHNIPEVRAGPFFI